MKKQAKFYVGLVIVILLAFTTKAFADLGFSTNAITGTTNSTIDLGSGHDLYLQTSGGKVGVGTATPGAKLSVIGNGTFSTNIGIGTNTPSSDDSALLIYRAATNPLSSGGSHAVRDESTYIASGTGGYASFDSIPIVSGALAYNHLHSFQARPNYSGSTSIDEVAGLTYQLTQGGAGTVTNSYGFRILDALGSGPITNQIGLWCDPLTRGTSNYCIYDSGTSANYLGGSLQIGGALQSATARFTGLGTTYGSILSHDTTGGVLDNSNLTIVNGLLTMSNNTTSKILASLTNLQLESTSGTVVIRPGASTSATFLANGSVGIGIASPAEKLHVSGGNLKVDGGYIYANGSGNSLYVQNSMVLRGGITNDASPFLSISGGTSAITYFTGSIGVGTTSPRTGSKLEVAGIIQTDAQSADPGCTATADIGKFWFDNTTTTTSVKVCKSVSAVLGWSVLTTTP